MSRAKDYADWVLKPENAGMTGQYIKLAAKRFLSDLERTDLYFDEKEAGKFLTFGEGVCQLWEDKWRGKPMVIELWMAFIYEQVYGWFYKETGLRRVRIVYIQVAKKNGKTTGLAGIPVLYHLFADERVNTPKIFVGANNEDQAKICVNIAGKIIEQSPDLYEYVEDGEVDIFQYKENIVNIVHRTRDGFIKAMSKEPEGKQSKQAGGKHGFNPSLFVIDEYAMADSAELLDTLVTAQAAREEPLGLVITTAGHKQNGPCYSKLRKVGIDILEGVSKDDGYLPFIWEMDKGDSIYDEKVWMKSNPNLGVSVFLEFLRSQTRKAKLEGGSTEVNIRTLNFNEWCETPEVWVPSEVFAANTHGIDESEIEGQECFGGIDITLPGELNSLALFFPNVRENIHAVKVFFWMPEGKISENKSKKDLARWVEEGFIKTCPGNVMDNEYIFERIFEEIGKYQLHSLSFRSHLLNHDILQALVRNGITCTPITQSYQGLSTPTKGWEELLTARQVEHFNNPVLAWSNSQCTVMRKDNDIKVQQAGGATAGIIACVNAFAQYKTVLSSEPEEAGVDFL